ncbi:MAG: hypothetical protein ACERKZ_17060 [Lachnotalea sp.]
MIVQIITVIFPILPSSVGCIASIVVFGPYYFSFTNGYSYFIFVDPTGTTAFDLQESC